MIVAAADMAHPNYEPQTWHQYLLFVLILAIQGLLCTKATRFIGYLNVVGAVANILVLLIFVFWLPAGSTGEPKFNSNREVWLDIPNYTEWPTGWAFIMGFLAVVWTMAGNIAPQLKQPG